MRNSKVQKMISVAMLASIGALLQFVAFPIIPAFHFLTIDFSDIPVMIGMFLFGPVSGIAIAFLRSLLHLLLTGLAPQNIIGNIASFLATMAFTLPMYYFFQKGADKKKNRFIGILTGILAMTIFMSVANYFVITPLYLKIFGVTADQYLKTSLASYVAIGIIPFNLIKGGIVSTVFLLLHARLLPWLAKKQRYVGIKKL